MSCKGEGACIPAFMECIFVQIMSLRNRRALNVPCLILCADPSHYVHEKFPSGLVKIYSRSAEQEIQQQACRRASQQVTAVQTGKYLNWLTQPLGMSAWQVSTHTHTHAAGRGAESSGVHRKQLNVKVHFLLNQYEYIFRRFLCICEAVVPIQCNWPCFQKMHHRFIFILVALGYMTTTSEKNRTYYNLNCANN